MDMIESRLLSIEYAKDLYLKQGVNNTSSKSDEEKSFHTILTEKSEDLKFSKHANKRLESRNITLSDAQLGRLNQGVDQARDKSINETLVMMDNLAFIVNTKNNTVITAMEQGEDASVFTNIDGAVIV